MTWSYEILSLIFLLKTLIRQKTAVAWIADIKFTSLDRLKSNQNKELFVW